MLMKYNTLKHILYRYKNCIVVVFRLKIFIVTILESLVYLYIDEFKIKTNGIVSLTQVERVMLCSGTRQELISYMAMKFLGMSYIALTTE